MTPAVPYWGMPFKLYSHAGAYLGVITIPQRISDGLARCRAVEWGFCEPPGAEQRLVGLIAEPSHGPSAVRLFGASLEEMEKQPGFAFAPGAGYLGSLIE